MSTSLLLLSDRSEDLAFWEKLSQEIGLAFTQTIDPAVVAEVLEQNPDAIVIWDTGNPKTAGLSPILLEKCSHWRIFSIDDSAFSGDPALLSPPRFAHHLVRRYQDPAQKIYRNLVRSLAEGTRVTLSDFFSDECDEYTMEITHSGEKPDIVQLLSEFLTAGKILDRLVTVGMDVIDELIMNAIFDAPRSDELGHYRRPLDRAAKFELTEREQVKLKAIVGPDLIGFSVRDRFGSLALEKVIHSIHLNFQSSEYDTSTEGPGAGLGVFKVFKSAMNILYLIEPGQRTEAIVLLPNSSSFREFKLGPSFFSVLQGPSR